MTSRISPRPLGERAPLRPATVVLTLLLTVVASLLSAPHASAALPSTPAPEGLPLPTTGPGTKIVGGSAVPNGKYPFQAALLHQPAGTTDRQRQFCGGSLISPLHVLTAAHCVDFFGSGPAQLPQAELRVVVGRSLLNSTQGQRRMVAEIAVHPNWSPETLRNDAAVITLARPVFGIRPVQLVTPGTDALERPGRALTATGWGNTVAQPVGPGAGGFSWPGRLREVSLPVVPDSECATAYTVDRVGFVHSPTMLCAGLTGRDTCQGDSGGPLFVRAVTGGYLQVGITSWGFGCAATGFPGVYTQLSNRSIGNFVHTAAGGVPF